MFAVLDLSNHPLRLWWNWQTRNLEVVVLSGVQVQVLLTAPFFSHQETKSSFRLLSRPCSERIYRAIFLGLILRDTRRSDFSRFPKSMIKNRF